MKTQRGSPFYLFDLTSVVLQQRHCSKANPHSNDKIVLKRHEFIPGCKEWAGNEGIGRQRLDAVQFETGLDPKYEVHNRLHRGNFNINTFY